MTVSYALGTPRAAEDRGGDCRARDLTQERNVHGPHRFAATTDCQISNGLLRLTVGAAGVAPSLVVEGFAGFQGTGDFYFDVYQDVYPGSYTAASWPAGGTIIIDSTLLAALLTGVRLVRISPQAVTIRLVSPVMADAYVTLRRGEPMVRIQHGSTRAPLVSTSRRVRWTGPTGTASTGRVTEALTGGFSRFVAALDLSSANAGAFSVTSSGVSWARFGAGIGTADYGSTVDDLHGQLADASRPVLVVA